jgi:hypothetical protein
MHKYQLISADTPGTLSDAVTAALADGWELWGNPMIYHNCGHGLLDKCFGQAVVRFEPEGQASSVDQAHILTDRPAAGYTVTTPISAFTVKE